MNQLVKRLLEQRFAASETNLTDAQQLDPNCYKANDFFVGEQGSTLTLVQACNMCTEDCSGPSKKPAGLVLCAHSDPSAGAAVWHAAKNVS